MKRGLALILITVLCLAAFTAFAELNDSTIVGNWLGEWVYNDNNIRTNISLYPDHTFSIVTFVNGEYSSTIAGNWAITAGILGCQPAGESYTYPYELTEDGFVNNSHVFTRW